MTNVDPLIQRELSTMDLGIYVNRDLTPLIVAKVRARKIRRAIISASVIIGLLLVASLSYGVVKFVNSHSITSASSTSGNTTPAKGVNADEVTPLISAHKIEFEPNTGDSTAISSPAGIGGTLLNLTAIGAKVDWTKCSNGVPCPSQVTLHLKNGGNEMVPAKIAISVFMDHAAISTTAKPTSVTAGGEATIIVPLPEIASTQDLSKTTTWQWNWYLVPNN